MCDDKFKGVCDQITYFPTFCCPHDVTCSHKNNLQESYKAGAGFEHVIEAAAAQCSNSTTFANETSPSA